MDQFNIQERKHLEAFLAVFLMKQMLNLRAISMCSEKNVWNTLGLIILCPKFMLSKLAMVKATTYVEMHQGESL